MLGPGVASIQKHFGVFLCVCAMEPIVLLGAHRTFPHYPGILHAKLEQALLQSIPHPVTPPKQSDTWDENRLLDFIQDPFTSSCRAGQQ